MSKGKELLKNLKFYDSYSKYKDSIYKAKLIKNDFPCLTIDEQYCWDIENAGIFCLIEPDYWCEI